MKLKILLTVYSCCVLAFTGMATTVSPQDALTVALNYFKTETQAKSVAAVLTYTKTEANGSPDFYIFNITSQKGFVIVAADDNIQPVLAFSDEATFQIEAGAHTGLSDWMYERSANIAKVVRDGAQAGTYTKSLWTSYRQGMPVAETKSSSVAPMVKTTWNQEQNTGSNPVTYLYNNLCPFNTTDNQRCLTGCVATAMAQLMTYWKFPVTAHGTYSYDAVASWACGKNTCTHDYGTLSYNFGATTFQWSQMPDALSSTSTPTQISAVGILNYACGIAVGMQFGDDVEDGSGAYVIGTGVTAQNAFSEYFGYNAQSMAGIYPTSDTATWVNQLKAELNNGQPFLYEGNATAGGHVWVCDGYNTKSQFHMNWGWGGAANGYFSVSGDIYPPNEYDFTSGFGALIGIIPNYTSSCGGINFESNTTSFIGTTSAIVSWSPLTGRGTQSSNIRYRKVGTESWTIKNTTSNQYTITGLTEGTKYEWQVEQVCAYSVSDYTSSLDFTTYCTAAGGNNTFQYIAEVQLGSIQNKTTGDDFGYTNYTSISTNLTTGSSHYITLTSGADAPDDVRTCYYTIYIDYNHNGLFTDPGEMVIQDTTTGTSAVKSATFTIPSSAYVGSTRMRVQMQVGSYQTNPCANFTNGTVTSGYGDVQDYTVNLVQANEPAYCVSSGTNNVFEYIDEVQFGSINNVAGGNDNGYTNFTSLSTNLTPGSSHYITLTSGFDSPDDVTNCYYSVYIDYNHNGVFDAGEMVVQAESKGYTAVKSKTFTVPATAYLGTTRMRIQMQPGSYQTNPCATYSNGDVQDYDVNIVPPAGSLSGNPAANDNAGLANLGAVELYPNPAQDNLNIAFNTDNSEKTIINIYNISGQRILSSETAAVTGSNLYTQNTATLSSGIYILEIENNGDVQRMKFAITR